MINIIIENDTKSQGIPARLSVLLETRFLNNREFWYNFDTEFKNTPEYFVNRLSQLTLTDNIIGETNFHELHTFEHMVALLNFCMQKEIVLNMYCLVSKEMGFVSIKQAANRYFKLETAFFTPSEFTKKKKQYKLSLNELLKTVFNYHNIFQIGSETDPKKDKIIRWNP